ILLEPQSIDLQCTINFKPPLNHSQAQNSDAMVITHQKVGIVELTTFKLAEGITDGIFLAAAEIMQTEFLDKQEGFLQRTLVKGKEGWTDIVTWADQASMDKALENSMSSPHAIPFMKCIDLESVNMKSNRIKFTSH
ncbi:MAG: hypothetical protein AAFO07_23555, partial [Bacteroidota bacterium]